MVVIQQLSSFPKSIYMRNPHFIDDKTEGNKLLPIEYRYVLCARHWDRCFSPGISVNFQNNLERQDLLFVLQIQKLQLRASG